MKLCARLVVATCLVAGALLAQDYRGSILGRVLDSTGAVVPGASIVAVNEATNVVSRSRSNPEGNFLVPLLDPGTYTLSVEAQGFKKVVRQGVAVRTGDKLSMDFSLDVGATTESVTVTGETPLVETNSGNISQVVDQRLLSSLYTSNRNPLGLASLVSGVTGGGGDMASDGQIDTISMNGGGASTGNNEVIMDGTSVVVPRQYGAITTSPSVDAVQEVRVETTMFDAAYGHSKGGVISYATRSGTNQVHGSFEDFYRNRIFDANTWLNNKRGLPRGTDSLTFWSGTFGGPVYLPKLYNGKNRTFFFTSIEHEYAENPGTVSGEVPTAAERQGDFSKTLNTQGTPLTIYDPYSTVVNGTNVTRQPFSGNKIPSSQFNPTGVAVLNKYPLPNISNALPQLGVYNWVTPGGATIPETQFTERVDHVISDKQRLFGRFGLMRYTNASGALGSVPLGLFSAPQGGGRAYDDRHVYNFTMAHDYTFSPTVLLETRLSAMRYWSTQPKGGAGMDPAELGVSAGIGNAQMEKGWPTFSLGGALPSFGSQFKARANNIYTINSTLTKVVGNHNVRFGGEARVIQWNENSPGTDAAGSFSFNATFTDSNPLVASASQTSGTSMASLLMGIPASGDIKGPAPAAMSARYYGGFVQDDWKVTPRLTLNIGIRYELETPYSERHDKLFYGFDFSTPSPIKVPGMNLKGFPLYACVGGNPCRGGNLDLNNFGPRFGFAWQVRPGMVIRGGYGIFYGSNLGDQGTSLGVPSTFSTNYQYIGTTNSGETPYTTLANPFPNGLLTPVGSSLGTSSLIGESVSFLDQNRVLAYTQQESISVQQSLRGNIRLEAAFFRQVSVKGFGTPGDNMQSVESFGLNELPGMYLPLGAQQSLQVPNPFYGIAPATTSLGSSKTVAQKQLWLSYPQFSGVTDATNGVNAQYQRVQLGVEKRLTHGLSLLFNWSISKLMTNNYESMINGAENIRSISDMDTPHILNLAWAYDLPFGPGRPLFRQHGIVGKVIGGWTFSGAFSYASGQPMSVSDSNGRPIPISNPALSGPIETRIGDQVDPVTHQVLNPYFKTNVWQSLPTQYMYTPEPPALSYLRGPASKGTSATLIKRWQIKERLNVAMRLDASSLFNTPQWKTPGTNLANKSTFGVIQSAGGNRKMQVGLRVQF